MAHKTNAFLTHLPAAQSRLKRWYQTHGRRDLPWRNTRDPYAIYLSEIMLQQTQVKTVLERYYFQFLKSFPTLAALAKAPAQSVMKAWEGLGYYTRAANLHKAAKLSKGSLPRDVEGLIALPGIGRNTAHAVACFAFGAAVPVMEANVKRVLCRVFALTQPDDVTLWEKAELLLDKKHPFDYNQAMMDIGSFVCTKRAPRCSECPLNIICKGQTNPEAYPAPKLRKETPTRKRVIVVFHHKGKYLLTKRDSKFLGGLYGFAEYDEGTDAGVLAKKKYPLSDELLLGAVTQTYSHFTLDAKVYLVHTGTSITGTFTLNEIKKLPLSRADLKIVKLIEHP